MPPAFREVIHGLRLWRRQPLFLLTSIAVLAVGLGANLAMFSVVNGLLLRPIVPDHPERLVSLYSRDATQPDSYRQFSYATYAELGGARSLFDSVLAHYPAMVGVTEGDTTRRAFSDLVSADFFATLGTPLAHGRPFTAAEAAPGADAAVAVISDSLFRRLGRPDDVLSRTLRLNGRDYAIVGVTPPSFTGTTALASPELWLPLGVFERAVNEFAREGRAQSLADPANHVLFLIGRLKPGTSLPAAARQIDEIGARLAREHPDADAHQQLTLHPVARVSISTRPPDESGIKIAAAMLLAVATVVLVIACLNVATLLLSRGVARRREIAIRLALGATRWRIVRQLLADGFVIATIACAIGIVLANRAVAFLIASIQAIAPLPLVFDLRPDGRTLAAAAAWTAVSTILFALGPAWKLTRADVADDLQRRPMFAGTGGWRRRLTGTNLLVVSQIALSLVLLTTAGLFLRGATRSMSAPIGFSLDGQAIATIDPGLGGRDLAHARQIDLAALDRIRSLPAVQSASLASTIPFGEINEGRRLASTATTRRDNTIAAGFRVIGRDYFRTMGVALVRGREFSEAEERGAPAGGIAVIDQLTANRLWPGADPLGRTIYTVTTRGSDPLTVVGVVAPMRHDLLSDPEPALYVPYGQEPRTLVTLHARTAPDQASGTALLPALRAALGQVDPGLPVLKIATLRTARDESASMWMVTTSGRIFGALGLLAAALAVTGLYGVVAYVVSRRVKEIGIRMALGAGSRDVLLLVLRDGLVLVFTGLTIGIALSAGAARIVRSLAASVAAVDATVFAVSLALLATAALLATLIPAGRAARLAPLEALREE